jgi:hypothetical protein
MGLKFYSSTNRCKFVAAKKKLLINSRHTLFWKQIRGTMDGVSIEAIAQTLALLGHLSLKELVEQIERCNLSCVPENGPVRNMEKVVRLNEFLHRMANFSCREERLKPQTILNAFELHASPRVEDFTTGVQVLATMLVECSQTIFTAIRTTNPSSFGDLPTDMIEEFYSTHEAFKEAMLRWTTHISNKSVEELIRLIRELKDQERTLLVITHEFDAVLALE